MVTYCRESPNSRGMLKMINRALKESSLRVYLLLIECKCAVLKEKLAGRESVQGPNAAAAFDVSRFHFYFNYIVS